MDPTPSSSSGRKRHSSSSTTSTITSSNNEEDLGPPATKQRKIERNSDEDSDYPSFHSQQKSSASTTDSEGEGPSEGGHDYQRMEKWRRALCDEKEAPKKPAPSYSSFSMKMMVSGHGLNTFLIN